MQIRVENQKEKELIENIIQELKGNSEYQPVIDSLRAALFQTVGERGLHDTELQACSGDNAWKNTAGRKTSPSSSPKE